MTLALYLYYCFGFSWLQFALFFFVPDLSFAAYLVNSKVGAFAYNLTHSLIGACLLMGLAYAVDVSLLQMASLIWLAHIGFDRQSVKSATLRETT